ncbi:MAG TPA: phosphotransferase, partial [Gammaproteobacteria bacterium]|nr:phosphotransferase [Gammaproteobacteria bacterium]
RIEFVAACLEERAIRTPQLVATLSGENHLEIGGAIWRLLTYVSGISYEIVPDAHHAFEAGGVLARFHGAFTGRDDIHVLPASTTHDIDRHLDDLRAALTEHPRHGDRARVHLLAQEIFSAARLLPKAFAGAPRVVHGDPKISNILFRDNGDAVCLVDLDTVGLMALNWELGDAFRSWCNPLGEDTENTEFSLALFSAALDGYQANSVSTIAPREVTGIVAGIETIYIELAARFCADALRETYFSWDPARFETHTAHNLVRARGQLNAARDLASKRQEAVRIVEELFAPGT